MTPEEIAKYITDNITVNNGLRVDNSKSEPTPYIRQPKARIAASNLIHEELKAFLEAQRAQAYYQETPNRVSILPAKAYEIPIKTIPRTGKFIRPIKSKPSPPQKTIDVLGKRQLDL